VVGPAMCGGSAVVSHSTSSLVRFSALATSLMGVSDLSRLIVSGMFWRCLCLLL